MSKLQGEIFCRNENENILKMTKIRYTNRMSLLPEREIKKTIGIPNGFNIIKIYISSFFKN